MINQNLPSLHVHPKWKLYHPNPQLIASKTNKLNDKQSRPPNFN